MSKSATKTTLWENTLSLMEKRYGAENLSRLARDTKIGPGSTSRIKAQETSVGVDVLEKIAEHFEVEPWQLMAPNLGAQVALPTEQMALGLTQDEIDTVLAIRAQKQKRELPSTPTGITTLPTPKRSVRRQVSGGIKGLGQLAVEEPIKQQRKATK